MQQCSPTNKDDASEGCSLTGSTFGVQILGVWQPRSVIGQNIYMLNAWHIRLTNKKLKKVNYIQNTLLYKTSQNTEHIKKYVLPTKCLLFCKLCK